MSYYPTRVELHDAKWPEDYEKLHAEMKNEGFSTTIKGDDGKTYHLPTAEYIKIGTFDVNDVLSAAKRAASKVKPKYAAIVWQTDRGAWHGLAEVK